MATLLPSSFLSLRRLSVRRPSSSRAFRNPSLLLRASLSDESRSYKKSRLSRLIQEIEPLDVSLIQKDVPAATVDAMKRTISGMLGLLPSDQFQVLVDALWESLSKLLVSSMITGYTLRNAEYRLCLEKSLDAYEEKVENQMMESCGSDPQETLSENSNDVSLSTDDKLLSEKSSVEPNEVVDYQGLDGMSHEAQEYIRKLQSHLSSVKKELRGVESKSAALQMQQFVGEETNDLLDYLRSLQPEKVAELSEPTSPELKETIRSVVHGLLATLSPKMQSTSPPPLSSTGMENPESGDCAEIVENTSLQFQPLISLTRDYLARLLFWCMLLGHYLKGLEYRVELMELLTLTNDTQIDDDGNKVS